MHRAEVLGMFAGNAEWILKHQIDLKQKKIIDLPSWATFCKGLVSIRQLARQKGVRWGLAFNDDGEADGSENEVDFARAGLTKDQVKIMRARLQKCLGAVKSHRTKKRNQVGDFENHRLS